MIFLIYGLQLT